MENSKYNFDDYKKDALTKPRDKAWDNWAKFDKVGDSVQGFIRDVFFRKAEGQFSDQRGLTLEQPDGTLINVGIKQVDFVLAKTNNLRLGDPVTIEFEKEIPSTTKGYSPTKQFAFYGKNLPENANQKTVLELENEDRKLQNEEELAADKAFNGDEDPLEETPEAPKSVTEQTTDPLEETTETTSETAASTEAPKEA